jgi:hypothetical protein
MKTETKVLLTLGLLALVAELGARSSGDRLSKDVAHLNHLSELSTQLRPIGPVQVLILGNSLSRQAFDRQVLERGWQMPDGTPAKTAALHPDASGIIEWSQAFRRYVQLPGCRPQVVLIGTGRTHLLDPSPGDLEIDRLGAWLVPPSERWSFTQDEDLILEQRLPFLLASQSQLFANRGRIQPLTFYNGVPGYEATVRAISERRSSTLGAEGLTPAAGPHSAQPPLRHLQRLLDDVRASGATPVIVALPVPKPYTLPPAVTRLLAQQKVRLIDFGSNHSLPTAFFSDGYHLNEEGGKTFTEKLLPQLRP